MSTISTYIPAILVALIDTLRTKGSVPPRFFRDHWFPDSQPQDGKLIAYDIAEIDRRMANFNHPDVEAKRTQRMGWKTKYSEPAYIREIIDLKASEFMDRSMGES